MLQALVADAAVNRRQCCDFVGDLGRAYILPRAVGRFLDGLCPIGRSAGRQRSLRQVNDHLPIRTTIANRIQCLTHQLYPPFAISESTLLFGKRGTGQHHIGYLRRFRHEDILDYQELSRLQTMSAMTDIRIRERRVLT